MFVSHFIQTAGLITFSNAENSVRDERYQNAIMPMASSGVLFGCSQSTARFGAIQSLSIQSETRPPFLPTISPPKIRKEFPETWIWESIQDER